MCGRLVVAGVWYICRASVGWRLRLGWCYSGVGLRVGGFTVVGFHYCRCYAVFDVVGLPPGLAAVLLLDFALGGLSCLGVAAVVTAVVWMVLPPWFGGRIAWRWPRYVLSVCGVDLWVLPWWGLFIVAGLCRESCGGVVCLLPGVGLWVGVSGVAGGSVLWPAGLEAAAGVWGVPWRRVVCIGLCGWVVVSASACV